MTDEERLIKQRERDKARWEKKKHDKEFLATRAAKARLHYLKNKGKIDRASRAYRQSNPEKSQIYNKRWRDQNRDKVRNAMLKKKYGISLADYEEMLKKQGEVCALCKQKERDNRSLAVDHDHKTGAVRELLCRFCNTSLGILEQKPNLVEAMALYLRKHKKI